MINLTDKAKKLLDNYLQQVRTCLKDCPTVDADEIEQNITEHIQSELAGAQEPVALNTLNSILQKLGSPAQWTPDEKMEGRPKVTSPLVLTYISFGLFTLFLLLTMPYTLRTLLWRPFFETFIFFPGNLLLVSFILARVALHKVWNPKDLGWQRWLAYPSLILTYIPILLQILLLPPILIHLFWLPHYVNYLTEAAAGQPIDTSLRSVLLLKIGSVGSCWIALCVIGMHRTNLVHKIFAPFANWFNRKHAIALLVTGLVITVLSASIYFAMIYLRKGQPL